MIIVAIISIQRITTLELLGINSLSFQMGEKYSYKPYWEMYFLTFRKRHLIIHFILPDHLLTFCNTAAYMVKLFELMTHKLISSPAQCGSITSGLLGKHQMALVLLSANRSIACG